MQRITHTHMHMYSYTKRNCSVYTAQTEVLTKITNKWRAQKWIFSIKKTKHHTRNITTIQQQYLQLSFVPGNSIISRFICSSCRDPAGTGNALPRELHEFWEQESLNSNISTCLADPIWPHISWKCQYLRATTKAEEFKRNTSKGAKSNWMPTGSQRRGGRAWGRDASTETAQQDNNSAPEASATRFCSKSPSIWTYPPVL